VLLLLQAFLRFSLLLISLLLIALLLFALLLFPLLLLALLLLSLLLIALLLFSLLLFALLLFPLLLLLLLTGLPKHLSRALNQGKREQKHGCAFGVRKRASNYRVKNRLIRRTLWHKFTSDRRCRS
jgi:membrane protein implicated in regulation of membrane protease activity